MTQYRLTAGIYTPNAIAAGIEAFAHLCTATAYNGDDHTILTISSNDSVLDAELLNYILTLSAQELLE